MAGLVLVFITIAFPVQLDGAWVTMLWAGEAALMFWIGRTNKIKLYEYLSYPLLFLTFFSIIQDWSNVYEISESNSSFHLLWNMNFFTSAFVIACFSFVFILDNNTKYRTELIESDVLRKIMSIFVPTLIIITAYFAFILEIGAYWKNIYYQTSIKIPETQDYGGYSEYNYNLNSFKFIWIVNFSLLFISLIAHLIIYLKRSKVYVWILQSVNTVFLLVFLFGCLFNLSELRESYLSDSNGEYFQYSIYYIFIRYISLLFVALLIVSMYRLFEYSGKKLKTLFDILVCGTLLWILSSELLQWLDIFNADDSYKLALSIFFGVYSLGLVSYGIWKDAKHIRLSAFILIGITLLKLFFYDLANLTPISRALILIILGLLMLGVSFLYIKFKNKIFGEKPNE